MLQLNDFKPLAKLILPDIGHVDTRGLIVIVGPNSSGKSRLLRDLYGALSGAGDSLVVAKEVAVAKPPDFDKFIQLMVDEGYVQIVNDSGRKMVRPATSFAGTFDGAPQQADLASIQSWWNSFDPNAQAQSRIEFLFSFGKLLVTRLFLDRRLEAVSQVGAFDYETTGPQNDLQALYINEQAHIALQDEIERTFGKAIYLDHSRGNVLCLRVWDAPGDLRSTESLRPQQMRDRLTIDKEGDGLKSYVAIALALLLGRRPVCLIDEPEMCLHPPQARRLGAFIGNYGASVDRTTMVATHSSHVLRGIIERTTNLQIIRMTRCGGNFHCNRIQPSDLREVFAKPAVRAESVLDGIFAEAAVVVEADGDRLVYQTAWESVRADPSREFQFTTVAGSGGIAQVCHLYKRLRIRAAVITDLDLITNPRRLHAIVQALSNDEIAERLDSLAKPIAAQIKSLPPTITSNETLEILAEVSAAVPADWTNGGDEQLRAKLSNLAGRLDRMRRIKRRGIFALPQDIRRLTVTLIREASAIGLFLVHVGELEEWLTMYDMKCSRRDDKPGWADEAAKLLEHEPPQKRDIWAFMARVGNYLGNP